MKKRIGLFMGVFLFISIFAHAKSDFQLYAPLLSFFKNMEVTGDQYRFEKKQFFEYGPNLYEIKNINLINDRKFGFYEAFMLAGNDMPSSIINMGLQISIGGVFQFFENKIVSTTFELGPHLQIYGNGIILGSEFNISAKFTPDRRCSPVVGITANLDFYSNRTCGFYETRTNYYYSSFYIDRVFVEYPIVKYFDFYIQPYIAFCVNLY